MLDHDDYRLTVYVLGELKPADQAEVEAALAKSPELREIVQDIRRADALLGKALQGETTAMLLPQQRDAIHLAAAQADIDLPVTLPVAEAESVDSAIEKLTIEPAAEDATARRWRAWMYVNAAVLMVAATLLVSWGYYQSTGSGVAYQTSVAKRNTAADTEPSEEEESTMELDTTVLDSSISLEPGGGVKPGYWIGREPGQEFVGANLADDQPGVYVPAGQAPQGMVNLKSRAEHWSTNGRKSEVSPIDPRIDEIGAKSEHGDIAAMAVAGDDHAANDESTLIVPLSQLHSHITSKEVEQELLKAQAKAYEEKLATARTDDKAERQETLQKTLVRIEQNQLEIDLHRQKYFAQREELGKKSGMHLDLAFKQSELQREEQVVAMLSGRISGMRTELNNQEEEEKSTRVVELLEDEHARRLVAVQQLRDRLKEINARTIGKSSDEQQSPKKIEKKPAPKKSTSWRRVKAVPNASRLMVGDEDELALEGMQANVRIDGFRARVIVDYYFYNDRNTRLEGNFKLRLPDDASLYYFAFGETSMEYRPQTEQLVSAGFIPPEALRSGGMKPADILRVRSGTWDNVKEARIVPREKAAHAYSETVRRRVDPALVEWAGAGVFNARVFPLAPRKLHRIVVGYDVNLTPEGDALTYQFQLPEGVPQTAVDIDLAALPGTTAEVTPTTRAFTTGGRAYFHIESPSDRFIGVRLEGAANLLLTGSDESHNEFFATRVTPELGSEERAKGATRAVFLVDTSLSSQPDKFNVWLQLMEATLTENRDSLKEFSTLFFGIDTHWWKEGYTPNTPENVAALLKYCHTLSLEGATDLNAALAEAAAPHWAKVNVKKSAQPDYFLLSDGAATWGETILSQQIVSKLAAQGGSVFAYKTGYTGTATGTLESLVRATGGSLISVADEAEVNTAAMAHRQRPWQLESVSIDGGHDLLIAGRPEMIYAGHPLMVVGRGKPTPGAELILELKRGKESKALKVVLADEVPSELAARSYGQVAVGQLEELLHNTEDVSVAYARHFRVTGQTCSLLMLDSEADYARFNIKPEADLQVVLTSPAAELITGKLKAVGQTLHDSKEALLAWLKKLETTPEVQFRTPAALVTLLDGLPAHAFELPIARLVCQQHTSAEWGSGVAEQLKLSSLNVEVVRFEAERRYGAFGGPDALKALSSLIEQSPGDVVLSRDVAYSALQWELPAQAYPLLRRVAEARPFEPQTYLALAQCAAAADRAELAMLYYEIALAGSWNRRYGDFRQIAALEYQQLLTRILAGDIATKATNYATARLDVIRRETSLKQADLIITAQWNTDRTDVDLHVEEPSGEICFYSHRQTRSGGRLTQDVTEGFGPEMYTLAKAQPGSYRVQMHYYRGDTNRTQAASKVYLNVYRNFGGRGATVERHAVVLRKTNDKQDVLTIKVPENSQ